MMYWIFLPFVLVGLFLVILGIWIRQRMYGKHSIEVHAECVDVDISDETYGIDESSRTHYANMKSPVYRYWYDGKYYVSKPLLKSNRPGYNPEPGPCIIRINPDHPERVYSEERTAASILLISIGALFLVMVAVVMFIFASVGL